MRSFKLKIILSFILMTVFGAAVCGSLLFYNFLKFSDSSVRLRLSGAAYAAEQMIRLSEHPDVSELMQDNSENTDFYKTSIANLSSLNAQLGTEYLYFIMKKSDGTPVFVLDSGTVDDPETEDSFLSEVEAWPSLDIAWNSGELVLDEEYYSDEWGTFLSACLPVLDDGGRVIAAIGADISATEIEAERLTIIIIFLVSLLAAVLVSAAVAYFAAGRIVKPINLTSTALAEISSGQGDLSRRLDKLSNDEIGTMVDSYNGFVGSMAELITRIIDTEKRLDTGGVELTRGIEQTSTALLQINSSINSIKSRLESQNVRLNSLFDALGGNGRSITGLNTSIDDQVASLEESSAAIEQMISNIKSVTTIVNTSEELFDNLKSASDRGMTLIETVSGQIGSISGQSESLQQANEVIAGIASQTNLLAMNAAIEAAHAGDAGKGFSVVADEIRKLAEESSRQSKTIGSSLKEVIGAIDSIVGSTRQAEDAFSAVLSIVDRLLPSSAQISGAMAEQNSGSSQILTAISELRRITDNVKEHSIEMMDNGVTIKQLMSELSEVSREVSAGMSEIENGASEINSAAELTAALAEKNRGSIAVLTEQTSKFSL